MSNPTDPASESPFSRPSAEADSLPASAVVSPTAETGPAASAVAVPGATGAPSPNPEADRSPLPVAASRPEPPPGTKPEPLPGTTPGPPPGTTPEVRPPTRGPSSNDAPPPERGARPEPAGQVRSETAGAVASEPVVAGPAAQEKAATPIPKESSLGRNTLVMTGGTLLSRITGLLRVLALGLALGQVQGNAVGDAYLVANTAPNIIFELLLGGILSATLIPVFVERMTRADEVLIDQSALTRRERRKAAKASQGGDPGVGAILSATLAASLVASVLVVIFAPVVIGIYTASDSDPTVGDERAVAVRLLMLFAPQVLGYGFIAMAKAILHANRRFPAPMYAPILNNLVVIGALLTFGVYATSTTNVGILRGDTTGLLILGLGTTAGVLVEALTLLIVVRRAKIPWKWHWEPRHPAVKQVLKLSGWTLGFVVANQIAAAVVVNLSRSGAEGKDADGLASAYFFAQMLFMLPHSIIAVSVMSALLPDFSSFWTTQDLGRMRAALNRGLRLLLALIVPAAVGYTLLSEQIVYLLDSRWAEAAPALAGLALGLPGFSTFLLLTRVFNAMQDTRTIFWLYVLENGLNIVLGIWLHAMFGLFGLGLSYGLAYTISAVVAVVILRRRIGPVFDRPMVVFSTKVVFACGVMVAGLVAMMAVVAPNGFDPQSASRAATAVVVVGGVFAGSVFFATASRLVGMTAIDEIFQSLRVRRSR